MVYKIRSVDGSVRLDEEINSFDFRVNLGELEKKHPLFIIIFYFFFNFFCGLKEKKKQAMRAYLKQRRRDILFGGENIHERRRFNFLLNEYRTNKQQIYGGMKRKRSAEKLTEEEEMRKANDDGVKKAKTLLHNHKNNVQNAFQAWIAEGECIQTLEGHGRGVMSVAIDGDRIVSGSDDNTIKIWDINTGGCIQTLEGHRSPVMSVAIDGDRIVSGSRDKTIKIWNTKGDCIKTLEGHSGWVRSVAIVGDRIVSGSYDKTIKIWNTEGECIKTLDGHSDWVSSVAIDGDRIVSGSLDKTIKIWSANTGTTLQTLVGHSGGVMSVAIDGDRIVSGSGDKTVKIWNTEGDCTKTLEGHDGWVRSVAIDGNQIISGSDDRTIKIWNTLTRKKKYSLLLNLRSKAAKNNTPTNEMPQCPICKNEITNMTNMIKCTVCHKSVCETCVCKRYYDNSNTAFSGEDMGINRRKCPFCIQDNGNVEPHCKTKKKILFFRLHEDFDQGNALSRQDDLMGLFKDKCSDFIVLTEVVFRTAEDITNALAILEDESLAHVSILTHGSTTSITTGATATGDREEMNMFDLGTLNGLLKRTLMANASILLCACDTGKQIKGHSGPVTSVAIDGDRIVSGSNDETIKIWNTIKTLEGHSGWVRSVAIDGDRIVSGSMDNTIKIWDINTGGCIQTLVGHSGFVMSVAIDKKRIVSGSLDNTVKIWNTEGECIQTLEGHSGCVYSVAIDGDRIVSGSDDKTIKIWNTEGEPQWITLEGHRSSVMSVAIDGDRIVSGSWDNTIKIWNTEGDCIKTLEGHSDWVRSVAIDGDRIVSGSGDKTVKIWNTEGECIKTLEGHSGCVYSVAIDGDRIVSGSGDKTIKIWNTEGECLQTIGEDGDDNKPNHLLSFENWCYPNFACTMARGLPGHSVFCTPNEQTSGELAATFTGKCDSSKAPNIVYLSSKQSMFHYINTTEECKFPYLKRTLDVDGVGKLYGGGDMAGYTRQTKTMLREYEQKHKLKCLLTRRGINQVIRNKARYNIYT